MKRAGRISILAAIIGCGVSLAAQDFSGTLQSRLGWFWKSPELLPLTQGFEGKVEGKVVDQDLPAAQYMVKVKVNLDPTSAATTFDLDETWIKIFAGPLDLSCGNQVVAWSVSDAFNPSDIVNPLDLSLPVDKSKIPVPLGRLVYNGNGLMVDLVAQPFWVASKLPGAGWAPVNPLTSIPVTNNVPDFTWDNIAYGGHLKASFELLQGLDLGATFYCGRSSIPRSTVELNTTFTPIGISLDYDRLTYLGADIVLAPGAGLLLKTEWGYTTLRDTSLLQPEAGASSLEGVSHIEYTLGGAQLIGEYVFDWAKGTVAAGDTTSHTLALIVSADIGSRVSFKISGINKINGGGVVYSQLGYTLTDGLQLAGEIYWFYGGSDTTYGAWVNNSFGRVSLTYSF